MELYWYVSVVLVVLLLLAIGLFTGFYRRASKDLAYVRTGLGGERVVVNSGAFVFPVLHDMISINMKTLRVEISRSNEVALITKDPLRVDTVAEFFLRVSEDVSDISIAARTLGRSTLDPEKVKDIVEAQCVAALRSVASTMTLDELHIKRTDFEDNVEAHLNKEFQKNGLQLVAVSLMRLDQTDRQYLDENNAFDARGLIKLDEITEASRKKRNDIEQENKIKIQEKNKEAAQQSLDIQQQEIEAQKKQEKYLANLESTTAKEIEEIRLKREQEIEQAKRDLAQAKAIFEKEITEAWKETDKARAEAARATEQVTTEREKAEAERAKLVEVIFAEKEADRQTIIAAANAKVEELAAKAADIRYQVEAAGKSAINEAANLLDNKQIDMQVKMEIVRQLPQIIKESVKPIENIDGIKIMHLDGLGAATGGGFSSGSSSSGSHSGGSDGGGNGSNPVSPSNPGFADQVVDSALRYRAQVPLIDSLLREVDLKNDSSSGLTDYVRDQIASTGIVGKRKTEKKEDVPNTKTEPEHDLETAAAEVSEVAENQQY